MSWTEKKLLLPFMGADSRGTRGQEEATGNAGSLGREEPQVGFLRTFLYGFF